MRWWEYAVSVFACFNVLSGIALLIVFYPKKFWDEVRVGTRIKALEGREEGKQFDSHFYHWLSHLVLITSRNTNCKIPNFKVDGKEMYIDWPVKQYWAVDLYVDSKNFTGNVEIYNLFTDEEVNLPLDFKTKKGVDNLENILLIN